MEKKKAGVTMFVLNTRPQQSTSQEVARCYVRGAGEEEGARTVFTYNISQTWL
jgi:hypothetical protein